MSQTPDSDLKTSLAALAGLLLAAAVAYLAIAGLQPPEVVPETAPAAEFSAARAARHVEVLASEARPVGSIHHDRARDYLVEQLGSLGLETRLQESTAVRQGRSGPVVGARVANIVARRPATDGERAVLLLAHYDSVASGPGAGDDASGVAAILEIARALSASPPLANDLLILLSDGEELGLLGAHAFLGEDPSVQGIGLVINLEARGSRGRSVLFETSPGNGRLIREFARVAPYPYANSLAGEVYRRMPNDTDLSPFKEAGLSGLNFAFLEGHSAYHSQLDTPSRLDLRSLQHHGSNALALVRHFGNQDLEALAAGDAVYFNPVGWSLFVYSAGWALPLALVALALVVVLVVWGKSKGVVTVAGAGRGLLLFVLTVVLGPLAVALLWNQLGYHISKLLAAPHGLPHASAGFMLAFLFLVLAIAAALYSAWAAKVGPLETLSGSLLGWGVLGVAVASFIPGASYLLLWPLLAGAAGLGVVVARSKSEFSAPEEVAILTGASVVAVTLTAPTIYMVFVALTVDLAAITAVPVAMVLGFLAPHLTLVSRGRRWWLAAGSFGVSVALLVWFLATAGFDGERPRTDSLFYLFDADAGEAVWMSFDVKPDPWTGALLGADPERKPAPAYLTRSELQVLESPAPGADWQAPEVRLISDDIVGDLRILELEVRSLRRAPVVRLRAESLAIVHAVVVEGRRIELQDSPDPFRLVFYDVPASGFRLTFEMSDRQPVEMAVLDQSYGLPELPGVKVEARPPQLIRRVGWLSDSTVVYRSSWQ
jgi:hypothetical protein